ncbi:MAG: M15 family metallopeptidase [Bacteroidetes bacterium]|nr:M15 family metallopeptidase [Bacteroidota bacterium]
MKIYQLYFLFVSILFTACNTGLEEMGHKIAKQQVIVNDTFQLGLILKRKINVDTSHLEKVFKEFGLIDIASLDSTIKIDLKYADTTNFLRLNMYGGLRKAYMPCEVALRLCNAQYYLKQINANYSLIIFDAARPFQIQKLMWDSLDMPPDIKFAYVSPPFNISLHNYGCAIDLSIIDLKENKLLDMGTGFDHFGKLSQPVYEAYYLNKGELSKQALDNRKLLRKVMGMAHFFPINSEWWHFNFCNKEFAAANYQLIK